MKSQRIGLIAENLSDIEVIKRLAKKVTARPMSFSHFVGRGCGPLKRKTPAWCNNLHLKGCTRILLVHDNDRNDHQDLRRALEDAIAAAPQKDKVIVIPTEELEAWLLSDESAIGRALNLAKPPKSVQHPEKIASPKEYLQKAVRQASGKKTQYVNSVHNQTIADNIDIRLVARKCPSFRPFETFFQAKV